MIQSWCEYDHHRSIFTGPQHDHQFERAHDASKAAKQAINYVPSVYKNVLDLWFPVVHIILYAVHVWESHSKRCQLITEIKLHLYGTFHRSKCSIYFVILIWIRSSVSDILPARINIAEGSVKKEGDKWRWWCSHKFSQIRHQSNCRVDGQGHYQPPIQRLLWQPSQFIPVAGWWNGFGRK